MVYLFALFVPYLRYELKMAKIVIQKLFLFCFILLAELSLNWSVIDVLLLLKGGLMYFCSDPPDGESSKAKAQQKLQSLLNNIKTSGHRRVLAKEPAIAKPKVQKLPKKDKVRIFRPYGNGSLEVNDQSC